MNNDDVIRRFFRRHRGTAVGIYPNQREQEGDPQERQDVIEWGCEMKPEEWKPVVPPEAPARPGEYPERFIDGCHVGHVVTCLRAPTTGWPVAVFLAEVGGVAMRLKGRDLVREFFGLERVVSFVADPFPWDEIETFAAALANVPDFPLMLLPARSPREDLNPFDYEVMRQQAETRTKQQMAFWEGIVLESDPTAVTLLDGRLASRLLTAPSSGSRRGLVIAIVKQHAQNYLHDQGWRTLLDLRPGQRTPFFRIDRRQTGTEPALPVATWYFKLAGSDMPNWGIIRVEVPWAQFTEWWPESDRTGFVNRLSRWLIDARCRQQSYARMPVSLEPIVRAENSLKSLFTPFGVLRNRFLRHAGVIGSTL